MNKARNWKVKRQIRIPQLKMKPGEEYPVQFVEPYHTEPSRDKQRDGDVTIGKVIDLDTGELNTIVINTVLKNLLDEEPDGYVGKSYLIEVGELDSEKAWRDMYLSEIDVDFEADHGEEDD